MCEKVFKPVSETKIIPVNGKVLIKVHIKGLSTKILVSAGEVARHEGREYYIAGTSVDWLTIGTRVLVDHNQIESNFIKDDSNDLSYNSYLERWKDIPKGDKYKAVDKTPTVEVVEYAIVHSNSINAIVTK